MPIPRLSKATGQLLGLVGSGRQLTTDHGHLTLSFCHHAAGDGLILEAELAQQPIRLWLFEAQWCQWIAPMLVVPNWHHVPAALQELLAIWTLADSDPRTLPWPQGQRLQATTVADGWAWKLRLSQQDRQLDLRVLDAPLNWLTELAEQALPLSDAPLPPLRATVSLIAGWSALPVATLRRLQPGDALRLQHQYAIANGEFGLFLNQPLASLRQNDEDGSFTIVSSMDQFDDWLDITPPPTGELSASFDHATVTIVAEVARLNIALQQLSALQPGNVLYGDGSSDGLVTLKAGGYPIARGSLLAFDQQLAIKIEQLC